MHACWALGQRELGRRQAPCNVITTVSPVSTTVTDLGELPVRWRSKSQAARATSFAIAELRLSIKCLLVVAVVRHHGNKKSRRGGTPEGLPPRRLTLKRAPQRSWIAPHLVVRRIQFDGLAGFSTCASSVSDRIIGIA